VFTSALTAPLIATAMVFFEDLRAVRAMFSGSIEKVVNDVLRQNQFCSQGRGAYRMHLDRFTCLLSCAFRYDRTYVIDRV
jgi:hypothetical protein